MAISPGVPLPLRQFVVDDAVVEQVLEERHVGGGHSQVVPRLAGLWVVLHSVWMLVTSSKRGRYHSYRFCACACCAVTASIALCLPLISVSKTEMDPRHCFSLLVASSLFLGISPALFLIVVLVRLVVDPVDHFLATEVWLDPAGVDLSALLASAGAVEERDLAGRVVAAAACRRDVVAGQDFVGRFVGA